MPRIRTIKPELFINDRCNEVSVTALLTFIGLLPQADDWGRYRDNAAIIGGVIWPQRAEHTAVHIEEDLIQLANAGLICRYTGCDGKRYLHIVGWFEHQKIDKPSQSRMPVCTGHHPDHRCGPCNGPCTLHPEPSPKAPGGFEEDSPNPPRTLDRPARPASTPPAPTRATSAPALDTRAAAATTRQGGVGITAGQEAFSEPSPKAPRILSEGSAPGSRILDPGSFFPTERDAPGAGSVSAKQLIGEYVASCSRRPPDDVIGHLGRITRKLLEEGITPEHVRAGLRRYGEIQGYPSRLPSLVNDAMNAPGGSGAGLARPGFGSNVPAHRAWTNPVDAATAYAEEL
ncbi:hypothetical protein [Streptomyces sp. NBC_01477]|uniref:hypothetical protein n=1 Tax=Streptomyces sp. NBC_01477 TaxID=2976015 RepID=UPI002E37E0EC|nr:hypothetical protein [Streptomyces sp. NBC_01477]